MTDANPMFTSLVSTSLGGVHHRLTAINRVPVSSVSHDWLLSDADSHLLAKPLTCYHPLCRPGVVLSSQAARPGPGCLTGSCVV